MGTLEECIHELQAAIKERNQKREKQILNMLSKVGMDAYTAKLLAREVDTEQEEET